MHDTLVQYGACDLRQVSGIRMQSRGANVAQIHRACAQKMRTCLQCDPS